MRKIAVIGTGYVGLVQGVVLAEAGHKVICVDISEEKVNILKSGKATIYEPGLSEMMQRNISLNRLDFTTNSEYAIKECDVIFLAVGTPAKEDGSADLQYILNVAKEIGHYINNYKVIIDKSTVPVGTGKLVKKTISDEMNRCNIRFDFDIVSNPEFLREGKALNDCMQPDRIVIGCENEKSKNIMKDIYDAFSLYNMPFVFTNIETAEMIKYASNAFLAVKISYINEIALLSEQVGADVQVIAHAMGMDKRISPKCLYAGPGYGGSCFPKDTKAIVKIGNENNVEMKVIKAAIEANDAQKKYMVSKIVSAMKKVGGIINKNIAVLGLSFKPETDDMRDAPSLDIIRGLVKEGAIIRAYCPQGMKEAKWRFADIDEHIKYLNNEYDAAMEADALVILTEWYQFKTLDLKRIKNCMRGNLFFDLRNVYAEKREKTSDFEYYGVGISAREAK